MRRRLSGLGGFLTLTTDFGAQDHYVGTMKAVVASVAPQVRVIDITHGIPSFDIAEGAFAIAQAYQYSPPGTVHVVVVDPGVGSSRRPIAVKCAGHRFVAPDNGVLSQILHHADSFEARLIDERHGLIAPSQTFHGRDIFAPMGARLAAGLPFEEVGPIIDNLALLPSTEVVDGEGCVLHVDRFGNIVTSFRKHDLHEDGCLRIGDQTVCRWAESYASVAGNGLFLILGSSGFIEVSLNRASAAEALSARAGDSVVLGEA